MLADRSETHKKAQKMHTRLCTFGDEDGSRQDVVWEARNGVKGSKVVNKSLHFGGDRVSMKNTLWAAQDTDSQKVLREANNA
jgi:hypothetical protein